MQPCRLPVGRHVDCHAQINQRDTADDNGELTEADTAAYPAILFRYQATLVLPSHREYLIGPVALFFSPRWKPGCCWVVISERINLNRFSSSRDSFQTRRFLSGHSLRIVLSRREETLFVIRAYFITVQRSRLYSRFHFPQTRSSNVFSAEVVSNLWK